MKKIILLSAIFAMSAPLTVAAATYDSAYTKFDYEKNCKTIEEYELGVSAKCSGYNGYPVYFSEGDLRQMVRFGHTTEKTERWQSFGEFNRVGETIEWRIKDGHPIATILRWYVENHNDETGEIDEQSLGQVLVISTIAESDSPHNACIAGMVDARANKNANMLARQIADTIAIGFNCDTDSAKFHGIKGKYAGSPTFIEE